MIDQSTPKGRVLAAALECAAARSWAEVSLLEIAEHAKVPLGEMRALFPSRGAILAELVRRVDAQVLSRTQRAEGQEKRDLLFDVLMTRFDVLAPYKAAVKSIAGSGSTDLTLVGPLLASQHWMLEAAGIDSSGPGGALRVAGLAAIYASVFRTWLEDDDPGHARTMAALDRRLRRGERALRQLDGTAATFARIASSAPALLRSLLRGGKGDRAGAPASEPEPPNP